MVDRQADSPANPTSTMPPRLWFTNAVKASEE
jgi:hypothetical protein